MLSKKNKNISTFIFALLGLFAMFQPGSSYGQIRTLDGLEAAPDIHCMLEYKDVVYAATGCGVYYSSNFGIDWMPIQGIPKKSIVALSAQDDYLIFAEEYGESIFRFELKKKVLDRKVLDRVEAQLNCDYFSGFRSYNDNSCDFITDELFSHKGILYCRGRLRQIDRYSDNPYDYNEMQWRIMLISKNAGETWHLFNTLQWQNPVSKKIKECSNNSAPEEEEFETDCDVYDFSINPGGQFYVTTSKGIFFTEDGKKWNHFEAGLGNLNFWEINWNGNRMILRSEKDDVYYGDSNNRLFIDEKTRTFINEISNVQIQDTSEQLCTFIRQGMVTDSIALPSMIFKGSANTSFGIRNFEDISDIKIFRFKNLLFVLGGKFLFRSDDYGFSWTNCSRGMNDSFLKPENLFFLEDALVYAHSNQLALINYNLVVKPLVVDSLIWSRTVSSKKYVYVNAFLSGKTHKLYRVNGKGELKMLYEFRNTDSAFEGNLWNMGDTLYFTKDGKVLIMSPDSGNTWLKGKQTMLSQDILKENSVKTKAPDKQSSDLFAFNKNFKAGKYYFSMSENAIYVYDNLSDIPKKTSFEKTNLPFKFNAKDTIFSCGKEILLMQYNLVIFRYYPKENLWVKVTKGNYELYPDNEEYESAQSDDVCPKIYVRNETIFELYNNHIYRSMNAGRNWEQVSMQLSGRIIDCFSFSGDTISAKITFKNQKQNFYSPDNGMSWYLNVDIDSIKQIYEKALIQNPLYCIINKSKGKLTPLPLPSYNFDGKILESTEGYYTYDFKACYYYESLNKSWKKVGITGEYRDEYFRFNNRSIVLAPNYALGGGGSLWTTEDYGKSWKHSPVSDSLLLNHSNNFGIFALNSKSNSIYYSTNFGASWNQLCIPENSIIQSLLVLPNELFIKVRIEKWDRVFHKGFILKNFKRGWEEIVPEGGQILDVAMEANHVLFLQFWDTLGTMHGTGNAVPSLYFYDSSQKKLENISLKEKLVSEYVFNLENWWAIDKLNNLFLYTPKQNKWIKWRVDLMNYEAKDSMLVAMDLKKHNSNNTPISNFIPNTPMQIFKICFLDGHYYILAATKNEKQQNILGIYETDRKFQTWNVIYNKYNSGVGAKDLGVVNGTLVGVINDSLFFSDDKGRNWSYLNHHGFPARLYKTKELRPLSFHRFRSGRNLMLSSNTGLMISEGDENWRFLIHASSVAVCNDVVIIWDSKSNNLLRSEDFGNSWHKINIAITGLQSFQGDDSGFLISTGYDIYRSTDEGLTWIKQLDNLPSLVKNLALKDDTLIVCSGNQFYYTSNLGNTWERYSQKDDLTQNILPQYFESFKGIYFIGNNNGLLKSTNLRDWEVIPTFLQSSVYSIKKEGDFLEVTVQSKECGLEIYQTEDGMQWFPPKFSLTHGTSKMGEYSFFDKDNLSKHGSGMYRWNPKYQREEQILLPDSGVFSSLRKVGNYYYASSPAKYQNNGWQSNIYTSNDNGKSWKQNHSFSCFPEFIQLASSWLALDDKVYISNDYGKSWKVLIDYKLNTGVRSSPSEALFRFQQIGNTSFITSISPYAQNEIFYSHDNGKNWETASIPGFINSTEGKYSKISFWHEGLYSISRGIYILISTDQGRNWKKAPALFPSFSSKIFRKENQIFALNENNITCSLDNGVNWNEILAFPNEIFQSGFQESDGILVKSGDFCLKFDISKNKWKTDNPFGNNPVSKILGGDGHIFAASANKFFQRQGSPPSWCEISVPEHSMNQTKDGKTDFYFSENILMIVNSDSIYLSKDFGKNWESFDKISFDYLRSITHHNGHLYYSCQDVFFDVSIDSRIHEYMASSSRFGSVNPQISDFSLRTDTANYATEFICDKNIQVNAFDDYLSTQYIVGNSIIGCSPTMGLIKSNDQGKTWFKCKYGLPDEFWSSNKFIYSISPTEKVVFVTFYFSDSYYLTFIFDMATNTWIPNFPGMPLNCRINAVVLVKGILWAATTSGIYMKSSTSPKWVKQKEGGLQNEHVSHLILHNDSQLVAVAYKSLKKNSIIYTYDGRQDKWSPVNNGSDSTGIITGIISTGNNLIRIRVKNIPHYPSSSPFENFIISRMNDWDIEIKPEISSDGGITWQLLNTDWNYFESLCNSGKRLIALANGGIYLSNDEGITWSKKAIRRANSRVDRVLIDKENLYALTKGEEYYNPELHGSIRTSFPVLYSSSNYGITWDKLQGDERVTEVDHGNEITVGNQSFLYNEKGIFMMNKHGKYLYNFDISPNLLFNDNDTVYAVSNSYQNNTFQGDRVFVSRNLFKTWEDISGDLPDGQIISLAKNEKKLLLNMETNFLKDKHSEAKRTYFLKLDSSTAWFPIPPPEPAFLIKDFSFSSNKLIVKSAFGKKYSSSNMGVTWEPIDFLEFSELKGIVNTVDQKEYSFARDENNTIYRATKGSDEWFLWSYCDHIYLFTDSAIVVSKYDYSLKGWIIKVTLDGGKTMKTMNLKSFAFDHESYRIRDARLSFIDSKIYLWLIGPINDCGMLIQIDLTKI